VARLFVTAFVVLLGCGVEESSVVSAAPPRVASPPSTAPAQDLVSVSPVELPACPTFTASRRVGTIENPDIVEASGIVMSRDQPGVLWVHNDSGDRPRMFATNEHGDDLGAFVLVGASAMDWEDLAIGRGPAPGRSYLYLGDIGDNGVHREMIRIYRVAEPTVTAQIEPRITDVVELELRYPDGPHNAETLMMDPISGALVVVVKTAEPEAPVFQVQVPTDGASAVLEPVTDLALGGAAATGGDISADGRWLAVRTYSRVFVWRRVQHEPLAAAFAREPCLQPLGDDGEAFAWLPTGDGYVTLPEGNAAPISRADW
jgi:hypothetical protein